MKTRKRIPMVGMLAAIVGGMLFAGCGKEVTTSTDAVKWAHKGSGFTAATTLAKEHTFLGTPGVTITFFDENVPPGTGISGKNCVEVFFPQQDTGFGRPTSVSFHKGSETVQESSGSGYDGQLTASDGKLSGELDISEIGYDEDSAISGSFEATLTGP